MRRRVIVRFRCAVVDCAREAPPDRIAARRPRLRHHTPTGVRRGSYGARRHRPLAVIACARANDGLRSSAVVHRLPPLEDTAMELLVRSLAGSRTLETDEVREVLKTSQGSPRLAIELVDEAMRSKRAATSVPPSARAAVAQLRAELSRTEFEVLRACSVIGDAFYDEWVPEVPASLATRSRTCCSARATSACSMQPHGRPTGSCFAISLSEKRFTHRSSR